MGNAENSEQYWPYICLRRRLLKAGGTTTSEGQLLELLQTIEKHCSWFPSLGTLDLGTWEKVGSELEKLGSALACVYLVNLGTDKIHFSASSLPRKLRGSEGEYETPSKGESEYAELEGIEAGQEATVRTGHGTTDWFQIGKGVCQGCILSPFLFNLYAEYIMRNAGLDEAQAGIKTAGEISVTSDMQMTPWQKAKN